MQNPPLRQLFLSYNAQTSNEPLLLEFTSASGIYLITRDGEKYADLISGIGVSNTGHGHPAIVKAVQEQAASYMHLMVYGEYVQSPQVLFAHELTRHLPSALQSVYFVSSGSEAVEGAMKLAKRFTGRTEIIAAEGAYHGSTHGALSLMNREDLKNKFRPLLPGIRFVPFNEEDGLQLITEDTACVILETIQGEAGVRLPDPAYLQAVRKRCTETGALLILDEIQCGFGRTGKLFAFQHYDIVPDILIAGKALGGGMPLGAFISSPEIMSVLSREPALGHITTFGGHPVCCAAGLAALRVLQNEQLIEQAEEKEMLFRKLLSHTGIVEIRGKGLLLALELKKTELIRNVIVKTLDKGVIIDWFLHDTGSLRLAPPLMISNDEIKDVCRKISVAIDQTLQDKF